MEKHFEHIFEGQIYTTRFDESANFVAVEVREAIEKTMKVYLIDVTLGEIKTEILLDWWDSLVAIAANRIIIQTYSTTSSTPKVIGITVFDSFAGKKVWEIAGFTFLENTKNTLTASKQQMEKLPE